ncbi:MAG: late competence development ComFB family protein, partial [Angelakisella sp.]
MAKARKEIDKDSMYQKIMPSAMRSVQPSAAEDTEAAPQKKAPPRTTTRKAPPKSAPAPAPIAAEAPAPIPAPAPIQAPAPAAADSKPNIVNIMELLIDDKIDLAMEKFHCCTCDRCRQDITAMALNK